MEAMNQFHAGTVDDGVSMAGAQAVPRDAAPHPLQCSGPDYRIEPDSHGKRQPYASITLGKPVRRIPYAGEGVAMRSRERFNLEGEPHRYNVQQWKCGSDDQ